MTLPQPAEEPAPTADVPDLPSALGGQTIDEVQRAGDKATMTVQQLRTDEEPVLAVVQRVVSMDACDNAEMSSTLQQASQTVHQHCQHCGSAQVEF